MIRLSDIFKVTNLDSIQSEDSFHRTKIHAPLILAALPACTQFGTMLLTAVSSTLVIAIPRVLVIFVGIVGVCVSALMLLLMQSLHTRHTNKTSLIVVGLASVLAMISFLMVWYDPVGNAPFLLVGVIFSGIGIPFALLICVSAYSRFSRRDVFANSVASFFIVDCFYLVFQIVRQSLIPLMIVFFMLSAVCCLILFLRSDALRLEVMSISGGLRKDEEDPKIKSLILSVPCLGTMLYVFTTGVVNVGQVEIGSIWVSSIGSLVIVVSSLFLYLHYRKRFKDSYAMFLLLDIGLSGFAVAAIFIKLIQLELFSNTVFLYLMKTYFLILLVAFWIELVQFSSLNSTATMKCCGIVLLCESAAFGIGALCDVLSDNHGVILGLITALFLIIAVISFGYNLILLAQSKEPDEPCELAEVSDFDTQGNVEEISRIVSAEYSLTPRESEVLLELTYGHSSSYIAHVLYISDNTVRTHMKNIYKKLGVHSREELIEVMRLKQTEQ